MQDINTDEIAFKTMYGLKSVISQDILYVFALQLVINSYKRVKEANLTGPTLVLCLFDMLKTIVNSGKGDEIVIEVKNEMAKRLAYKFHIRHVSQIKETVRKLADPCALKKLLAILTCTNHVPAVNWPVVEGGIKVHSLMKNAGTLSFS